MSENAKTITFVVVGLVAIVRRVGDGAFVGRGG